LNKLFDLTGKVAIVTGGNGGIGLGMARGLASAGALVVVAARNRDKGNDAVAELEAFGGKAAFLEVDVTDESSVNQMINTTAKLHARIDILVNNAGTSVRKPPQEVTLDEWRRGAGHQPDQRLHGLQGVLSPHEATGRRQDHQHRLHDVPVRFFDCRRLLGVQGRCLAADEVVGGGVGARQHPG
jgi:NADP-dependent 3-hydroxy acid dehydrogenase YdfG